MQVRGRIEFQGTVLIADDHEIFRFGLAQLLRRSLKVKRILEAASFAQVVEHLRDEEVTLVIVDLKMPGLADATEIRRLRLLRPDILVVVLSGSECRGDILRSLSAGAHGYIVKKSANGPINQKTSPYSFGRSVCARKLGRATTQFRRSGVGRASRPPIQAAAPSSQGACRGQVEQGNCTSTQRRRGHCQTSSRGSIPATRG